MEAYKIESNYLLIETDTTIYYLWNLANYCDLILDKFKKIDDNNITYKKTIFPKHYNGPTKGHREMIEKDYFTRKSFPKIKLEQLLTHQNNNIRTFIRKIIDGSI